jgi:hypothetical protein
MHRCIVRWGLVAAACLMAPAWASAQIVGDDSGGSWRTAPPRWGFFNISRRRQTPSYEDAWLSRDPAMGGEPAFGPPLGGGPELWDDSAWDGGSWGTPGLMGDCCQPVCCDPCGDGCPGTADVTAPPSSVMPGTPRALPLPTPLDHGTPGPEYVPRGKTRTGTRFPKRRKPPLKPARSRPSSRRKSPFRRRRPNQNRAGRRRPEPPAVSSPFPLPLPSASGPSARIRSCGKSQ